MTFHLPVLPPTLSAPSASWAPRESFSPSQLAQYAGEGGCKRKWGYRSLFGVGEVKQSKGRALGSLIHACLELYLKGGTVYDLVAPGEGPILARLRVDEKTRKELATYDAKALAKLAEDAPKRALAGLRLVPDTKDPALECVEVEQWIKLDTTRIVGGIEPIKLNGKIDLSFRRAGVWYLHDHKSTKGRREPGVPFDPWAYCKSPADLATDPQSVFYGLDRMYRHGIDSLWSRWAYFLTDPKAHPEAKPVDVELHRSVLEPAAYGWLVIANEMREAVRAAKAGTITPADLAPTPDSCPAFGGCAYHHSRGGPCHPLGSEVKLSDFSLSGLEPAKEGVPLMSLAEKYAQTQAGLAGAPVVPNNPLLPPEAHAPVAAPAPALPPLPQGWEYGPGNTPRQTPPPGYQYNASGQVEAIPAPPPAVAPVAAPAPAPAPIVGDKPSEQSAESSAEAEASAGKGRPKGAKNKPKPTAITDIATEMRSVGVMHATFNPDGSVSSVTLDLHAPQSA
jgi:hypothetical protein